MNKQELDEQSRHCGTHRAKLVNITYMLTTVIIILIVFIILEVIGEY